MKRLGLCLLVALLGACGGDGGPGGTSPASRPGPVANLTFSVTPLLTQGGSRIDLTWPASSGASSYRVHLGLSSGVSDVGVIDTGSTVPGYAWQAPVGHFFIHVSAVNAVGEGSPSHEVEAASLDPRDVIAGLLLAVGPSAVKSDEPGGPGCFVGHLRGWAPGTTVQVVMGSSLQAQAVTGVRNVAAQFGTMSAGAVQADVRLSDEPDPMPTPGQITAAFLSDREAVYALCCSAHKDCGGCVVIRLLSTLEIQSARIVTYRSDAPGFAHEMGHAFGLCHFRVEPAFKPDATMSYGDAGPELRASEVEASKAAYSVGMAAGTTSQDFASAGLIRPEVVGTALPLRWPPSLPKGWTFRPISDSELEIVKPFCRTGKDLSPTE